MGLLWQVNDDDDDDENENCVLGNLKDLGPLRSCGSNMQYELQYVLCFGLSIGLSVCGMCG